MWDLSAHIFECVNEAAVNPSGSIPWWAREVWVYRLGFQQTGRVFLLVPREQS
jgi:hypothetical protein